MTTNLAEFLSAKQIRVKPAGFDPVSPLNRMLFDFQRDTTRWGLRKGKCAFFEDCGLGKSFQQIEWGWQVHIKTGGMVIIFAPLAVVLQTVREGVKLGISVTVCRSHADCRPGLETSPTTR